VMLLPRGPTAEKKPAVSPAGAGRAGTAEITPV
jgi:hypothetical protein